MALRVMVFGSEEMVQDLQSAGMTGGAMEFVAAESPSVDRRRGPSAECDAIVVCLEATEAPPQELCEQLRATTNLPLVVLAEEPDVDTVVEVLGWGADECLDSSLSSREIVTHIRAQIRRATHYVSEGEPPEQLRVGSLEIDIARHQATLQGEPLDLTPKEFALLACLARYPGRVVPREEIIAAVWGDELGPHSRSLAVHIGRLRRKIEPDPANPQLLITMSGVGYTLQAE